MTPPWGMLTGVRPDKPVTWALEDGKSPEEARAYLEEHYFVTPSRAALALETRRHRGQGRPAAGEAGH